MSQNIALRLRQLRQALAKLRRAEAERAALARERDELITEIVRTGGQGMTNKVAALVGVSRQMIHRIASRSE